MRLSSLLTYLCLSLASTVLPGIAHASLIASYDGKDFFYISRSDDLTYLIKFRSNGYQSYTVDEDFGERGILVVPGGIGNPISGFGIESGETSLPAVAVLPDGRILVLTFADTYGGSALLLYNPKGRELKNWELGEDTIFSNLYASGERVYLLSSDGMDKDEVVDGHHIEVLNFATSQLTQSKLPDSVHIDISKISDLTPLGISMGYVDSDGSLRIDLEVTEISKDEKPSYKYPVNISPANEIGKNGSRRQSSDFLPLRDSAELFEYRDGAIVGVKIGRGSETLGPFKEDVFYSYSTIGEILFYGFDTENPALKVYEVGSDASSRFVGDLPIGGCLGTL